MSDKNIKTFQYLCAITNHLDAKTQSAENIVRQLREKCVNEKDEYGHNLRFSKEIFGPQSLCSKCLTSWSKGLFKCKLQSSKKLKSKKKSLRKLLNKDKSDLNKFQSALLKRLQSNFSNFMVLTCLVCNQVTKIQLMKKNSSSLGTEFEKPDKITQDVLLDNQMKKKKRKKKKKDLTCGIKKPSFKIIYNTNTSLLNSNSTLHSNSQNVSNSNSTLDSNGQNVSNSNSTLDSNGQNVSNSAYQSNSQNVLNSNSLSNKNELSCQSVSNSNSTLALNKHNDKIPGETFDLFNLSNSSCSRVILKADNLIENEISSRSIDDRERVSINFEKHKILKRETKDDIVDMKSSDSIKSKNMKLSNFIGEQNQTINQSDTNIVINSKQSIENSNINNSKLDKKGLVNKKTKLTKINLLSQPFSNKLQNINVEMKNIIDNKGIKISKNKINNNLSNSNKLSKSNKGKKQGKHKSNKFKRNVFKNDTGQNSLCVQDLLHLV